MLRHRQSRAAHSNGHSRLRPGYLLLETVIAVGLLAVGLAVIGSQVVDAERSVSRMRLELRAMLLAEQYLAEMDLGLVELDSLDEVQEEDFGPRFPDYGWRLITQKTSTDALYLLTLEVLHARRDNYDEEEFDFDNSEILYTVHTVRATPQPIDLGTEFGLNDEELESIGEKLAETGIDGLTPENFDPKLLAKVDSDQLIQVLPIILDAFGQDVNALLAQLPPDVAQALQESGLLEGIGDDSGGSTGQPGGGTGQPGGSNTGGSRTGGTGRTGGSTTGSVPTGDTGEVERVDE